MITEQQYKRFGIHDQTVDLVADQKILKPIFEDPSELARKKNDPRVAELIQRMVRRLDRLEDSVSAIQEMLPPQDEEPADDGEEKIADESQDPQFSVSQTSDPDTKGMKISEETSRMDAEEGIDAETVQKSDVAEPSKPETFKFKCPHCCQELEVGVEWQGKLLECPSCHKNFPIPPAFCFVKSKSVPAEVDITQNQNPPESPDGGKTTVEGQDKPQFVYQCTGCGKICDAAAKFCSECGSKVEPKQESVCQTDESDGPAFQKTSSERFDIIVDDINAECKISVMKVVREITNMGLADAKAFVENLPSTLVANIPKEKAEEQKHRLEEAGADVYLEPSESPDVQDENESARNVSDKKGNKTSSNAGCSLALLLGTSLFISIWAFLGFWYALIISVVGSFILFMIFDDAFSKTASTRKAKMKHPVAVAFILGAAAFFIAKVNIGIWQAFVCAIGIMIVWGLTYDDIFAGGGADNGEKKDERGEDKAKNGEPDTDERDEKNAENDADEQFVADTDSAAECDDNTGHEFTCPHCGRKKIVPESFVGLHTRCECGRTFSTAETSEEQSAGDLHTENLDGELPRIKLTDQAKKGEEWLKKNLYNGKNPTRLLVDRFLSNRDLVTDHEETKFERLNWDDFNKICVQAYAKCLLEWFKGYKGRAHSNSGPFDPVIRAANIARFETIFFDLLSTLETGTKNEQSPDDFHSEDVDDEMPKIKLTAQAKIGEEWLKRNLCNGKDPAEFLLNRFRNHIPLLTRDEISKFAGSDDAEYVKAYLKCHQEWIARVIAYKQSETRNQA